MTKDAKQTKRTRRPAKRSRGGGVYVNGERVAGTEEAVTRADPKRVAERAARRAAPIAATKETDDGR
jgi:hypothetical protein